MKLIHIALISAALLLAGCSNTMRQFDAYSSAPPEVQAAPLAEESLLAEEEADDGYIYYGNDMEVLEPEESEDDSVDTEVSLSPRIVPWHGGDIPHTIVIATSERALYVVNEGSVTATRFPIAVGKEGFAWTGIAAVGQKKVNPTWTPPAEMLERKPELRAWENGMPGGIPENPLGTRALYLYDTDGHDTLYRIHGTNVPESIGTAASSGCIRMLNAHVEWLYARVPVGARVVVAEEFGQDMAGLME
ncbi:MAG: hypothetical protein RLZZ234_435 [Candidatus Parcubacteria bacterium]|jgi:lipoprotein-anchoring transpeptidase ErfK/SrfK